MRVLVCGGRDFLDAESVYRELDGMHAATPITAILQGGATGADALAMNWALNSGVDSITYEADWKKHGRAAGPIRNQQMLDDGRPDVVVAFPGGRGTADMVRRARAAGVTVIPK